MIEIDTLRRIHLRDLDAFFINLKRFRPTLLNLMERKPEKIREALALVANNVRVSITLSTTYNVEATINENAEIESFLFKWEYDGVKREQRVYITARPSNLHKESACYYFLCPFTSHPCRKLYTDGKILISRYGFRHTYSDRKQSKQERELTAVINAMQFTDQDHRHRKEYYRGKITPFGRKMMKSYNTLTRYLGDFRNGVEYNQAKADFEAMALTSPQRGRPRRPTP